MWIKRNPKLFALAFLLDQLGRDFPELRIVVRVQSEIAGQALSIDLSELGFDVSKESEPMRWVTMAERLPWAAQTLVEIYPGAIPPWRMPAFRTGESPTRLLIAYPFEVPMVQRALQRGYGQQQVSLRRAFNIFGLGTLPALQWNDDFSTAYEFKVDPRRTEERAVALDLSVNPDLIFAELDTEEAREASQSVTSSAANVQALPVLLEPNGEIWWVRDGARVEVLFGEKHTYRSVTDLRTGDVVIVPHGEGRESLFAGLGGRESVEK